MGGLIEDKIFEVIMRNKLTVPEIIEGLEKIHYEREYNTINRHLRNMTSSKQLKREKDYNRKYVYWNPCMYKDK
jgi:hypothetical protein